MRTMLLLHLIATATELQERNPSSDTKDHMGHLGSAVFVLPHRMKSIKLSNRVTKRWKQMQGAPSQDVAPQVARKPKHTQWSLRLRSWSCASP